MAKRMKHKIYFSVCGEGYGHSSRDMAIAKALEDAGAQVLMGGYGYVLDRMKKSFKTVEIKREFEMTGNNGSFDMKATILKSSKPALGFSKIVAEEKKNMGVFGATCAVADGRSAAILAAFQIGIPCVVIANQTSLESFFMKDNPVMRIIGKNAEFSLSAGISIADVVLIPDFPPPDTVCLGTLGWMKHIKKKEIFTGPVVFSEFMKPGKGGAPDITRPFVLTILGGHAFRLPIFEGILEIAPKFPKVTFLIFTKFKSDKIPKNVVVREFADDISEYMRAAELIITQAGHSTAMEILALGKPALIIPDKGQAEQGSNAERMKALGVAETLDYSHLGAQNLFRKISMLLRGKKYKENAAKYSKIARKMNGAKKAAEIILEYSERVQKY
ncbi:MAG: UDP-N-acetylglucosamine--N-acetylmuramyl-(pentapeptide) pyrophosphoryl-undecaprenol N-acetylglucosamine transferase [Nanoarchaeota archaeon]|nr:UDP-N-acetylglucosamine--N-acetylmuramyl-(pentapeptide) pyrophosphoryl-undecaprenol N-acetylglucosamine transferase [Nanoarchaeota archaeon]MBU4300882.1 UDP-N-acetylglucosamine--N-acetylmuramyl-(pentapeptide) pyrophosphoryl-undecaprenol N-acetylglucosamine transferase [Nanoarchaeota archaeon]MBU4451412.1 UDP-N-acetylglucosamine--N-acetylmuramyl-(pentapeptide) pyrophosphoryl-undecaprenol N-acetylglucosamine transferase [Nanoarchaeota archaeon]MCG2724514.1 UDP-N-acetylglucosamine--N-acetylmuram